MFKNLSLFFYTFMVLQAFSQTESSKVLFTVENEPITAKEFIKVYNKNLDLVKDESQKDVDTYIQLYINYQLKLKEAKRLGLQNEESYKREFGNYKEQLIQNYLSESNVTEALVKEAYDRLSKEIKAVHILLRLDEKETDTTAIYNRSLDLRERLKNEHFEKLKTEMHDGQSVFVEDLGYFTGFKMVYPFETAAYETGINEVSYPFRTRFGFHIVKVLDKRPYRGEVTVSHIMVADNKADTLNDAKARIDKIYLKLQQGENFESVARQFSDDKGSAEKGGLMEPFQGGQLSSTKFEEEAFALKDKGEVSKPFKTGFGWHIIRLEKKEPLPPFEQMKQELELKVKRDSRSNLINNALLDQLRKKYLIKKYVDQINHFKLIISDDYFVQGWNLPENLKKDEIIASVADHKITNQEFGKHLMAVQRAYIGKTQNENDLIEVEFKKFLDSSIIEYHKNNLENINEDFAFILKEYRDGLLLFDLMEKEIWNAALADTSGLKAFYEINKNNYVSPISFDGVIISSADKNDLEKALEELKEGESIDEVNEEMNTKSKQRIMITKGNFDLDHALIPQDFEFNLGISDIFKTEESYSFAIVDKVSPAHIHALEDARGRVISDYQTYLEEEWLKELRKRFKVTINEEVLTEVKSKLSNANK